MIVRTKILLADDHALLRESLRMLIDAQADLSVVGESGTVAETIQRVRELGPDVICVDISMPPGSGVKLTETILKERPKSRILILTMHGEPPFVRSALAAGATGYCLKSSNPSVFLHAIRAVRDGRSFLDPALESIFAKKANGRKTGRPTAHPKLSEREREVLGLLAQGLSYQDVAARLFVSVKTVETYRTRLGAKLGFVNKADLVRYAIETGLLETPGDEPGPVEA